MRHSRAIVVSALLALTLATTATAKRPPPEPVRLYEGEPMPLEQVASIGTGFNLPTRAGGQQIGIFMIDGKVIKGDNMGVHVLPGEHEFTFMSPERFGPLMKTTTVTLKLNVEAGHSYVPAMTPVDGEKGGTPGLTDAGTQYDQRCLVGVYPDKSKTRASAVACL